MNIELTGFNIWEGTLARSCPSTGRRLPDAGKDSETNLPEDQVLTFHMHYLF